MAEQLVGKPTQEEKDNAAMITLAQKMYLALEDGFLAACAAHAWYPLTEGRPMARFLLEAQDIINNLRREK